MLQSGAVGHTGSVLSRTSPGEAAEGCTWDLQTYSKGTALLFLPLSAEHVFRQERHKPAGLTSARSVTGGLVSLYRLGNGH